MSPKHPTPKVAPVQMVIALVATNPPEGTVAVARTTPVAFIGWLGLISTISRVLEREASREGAEARSPAACSRRGVSGGPTSEALG
jgi:hypothetical protein